MIGKRQVGNMIGAAKICFVSESRIAILGKDVQSYAQASGSFVLTLAHFMSQAVNVDPEVINPKDNKVIRKKEKTKNYFEAWCDLLYSNLCQNHIFVVQNHAVLYCIVNNSFLSLLQSNSQFKMHIYTQPQKQGYKQLILKYCYNTSHPPTIQKTRKIAIINMSTATLNSDKLQPKIHLQGLYSGLFYQDGDLWHSYQILKNNIPTIEELTSYDVVVLSGSSHSILKMPEEIKKFMKILEASIRFNAALKVLGVCFGHQMIAMMAGAVVERKEFVRGLQQIHFQIQKIQKQSPIFNQLSLLKISSLHLYQFHHDHVMTVPQGYHLCASSKSCPVQILISDNNNILTFQFHPEYTFEYLTQFQHRWQQYKKEEIAFRSFTPFDVEIHRDTHIFRKIVSQFINCNKNQ